MMPEEIEALAALDILSLKQLAKDLHAQTAAILSLLSPQDIEAQEVLRTALILKMREAEGELSKQIADLRAVKNDLSIAQDYAVADRAQLRSQKIGLYVKQKELRFQS